MARVTYWFVQNCQDQIPDGVLAGQTPPFLTSFCSLGKQKELTKITQPAQERHGEQQLERLHRAESITQTSRADANMDFMGLFSWMACVSMLKISNLFQLIFILHEQLYLMCFLCKKNSTKLRKRSVGPCLEWQPKHHILSLDPSLLKMFSAFFYLVWFLFHSPKEKQVKWDVIIYTHRHQGQLQ